MHGMVVVAVVVAVVMIVGQEFVLFVVNVRGDVCGDVCGDDCCVWLCARRRHLLWQWRSFLLGSFRSRENKQPKPKKKKPVDNVQHRTHLHLVQSSRPRSLPIHIPPRSHALCLTPLSHPWC
jgi:hypothetical protein